MSRYLGCTERDEDASEHDHRRPERSKYRPNQEAFYASGESPREAVWRGQRDRVSPIDSPNPPSGPTSSPATWPEYRAPLQPTKASSTHPVAWGLRASSRSALTLPTVPDDATAPGSSQSIAAPNAWPSSDGATEPQPTSSRSPTSRAGGAGGARSASPPQHDARLQTKRVDGADTNVARG
jgi:hypothetical protein